jgi:hypothetical protein
MDPFNTLSTATATWKIPPLKEAPPTKVMSCALVASTDLEKDLDAVREVIGGADMPLEKMAGRPANSPRATDHGLWPFGDHQHTKAPLVPGAVEHARLVLFPLIR